MSCPICYDVINAERNNCITSCGHAFCFECIARTVETSDACPLCREPFIAPNPDDANDSEDSDAEIDDDDETYSESSEAFVFDEELYEDERVAKVKTVLDRLTEKGIGAMELLSIMIDRYERNDKNTPEFIETMNNTFEQILNDADDEAAKESNERDAFALEDRPEPRVCSV